MDLYPLHIGFTFLDFRFLIQALLSLTTRTVLLIYNPLLRLPEIYLIQSMLQAHFYDAILSESNKFSCAVVLVPSFCIAPAHFIKEFLYVLCP